MAHEIFISYASGNRIAANTICAELEAARIHCWIAPRDVLPGETWPAAILKAIQSAQAMVLVFTAEANASSEVLKEVTLASKYRKAIVPFRIEEVEPCGDMEYHLSTPHWLDAMPPPMELHVHRLVESVARILGREFRPARAESPEHTDSVPPTPIVKKPESALAPRGTRASAAPNYFLWGSLGGFALLVAVWVASYWNPSVPLQREYETPVGVETRVGKWGLRYVKIPAGKFEMGCSRGDDHCLEEYSGPRHQVRISRDFWMGQTEVTVGAYKAFSRSNKIAMPPEAVHREIPLNPGWKNDSAPMVHVTWYESRKFCESSGGRLPSESEWEYAARAGSTSSHYGELDRIAWVGNDSAEGFHNVAQKEPNAFGLFDMLGSVSEWTADWHDPRYYANSPDTDPQGPSSGLERSVRGGAWYAYIPLFTAAWYRDKGEPDRRYGGFGFRCVGAQVGVR